MGYRAQVITQHREYGGSIFFDWDDFVDYFNRLREEYQDREDIDVNFYSNDAEDFFEIPKDVLKEEVKKLEKLDLDGTDAYGSGMDNSCLLENIKVGLEQAPAEDTYIAVEWY